MCLALLFAGCGGGDDSVQPTSTTDQETEAAEPDVDPGSLEDRAAAFGPLLGTSDPEVCEFFDESIESACPLFSDGTPSPFFATFADAEPDEVRSDGAKGTVTYSNGESTEWRNVGGSWFVSDFGGSAK